jgi:hypothetical protein
LSGTANRRELLLNAVTIKEPKTLTGFSQTALQRGLGLLTCPTRDNQRWRRKERA